MVKNRLTAEDYTLVYLFSKEGFSTVVSTLLTSDEASAIFLKYRSNCGNLSVDEIVSITQLNITKVENALLNGKRKIFDIIT